MEPSTKATYRGYLKKHVLPFVGKEKVGKIDAEILDSLYYEMRRCREHCSGRTNLVDHRTPREHECDARCRAHQCRPLGESTIRQVHMILSGAFRRAQRWKWISVNPYDSENERSTVIETWNIHDNYHRPHSAAGDRPPAARLKTGVTNLPPSYT